MAPMRGPINGANCTEPWSDNDTRTSCPVGGVEPSIGVML